MSNALLETGDPAQDPRAFRRALGQFATGVTVVTAPAADGPVGVTVNSFTSLSLDPPLVLWSIAKAARSAPAFAHASHFAVNVLAESQVELSARFARSGVRKFDGVRSALGLGGAPLLEGAAAHFECAREPVLDGGDHTIVTGRVLRYTRFDREPLVFARGQYAAAVYHPQAVPPGSREARSEPHPLDDFVLPLLLAAYERLSDNFHASQGAADLGVAETRTLACLAVSPGAQVDTLARLSFLGLAATEDAVASLIARGDAVTRPPGAIDITAEGRARLAQILDRAQAFEAAALRGFSGEEIALLRRMLAALAGGRGAG